MRIVTPSFRYKKDESVFCLYFAGNIICSFGKITFIDKIDNVYLVLI